MPVLGQESAALDAGGRAEGALLLQRLRLHAVVDSGVQVAVQGQEKTGQIDCCYVLLQTNGQLRRLLLLQMAAAIQLSYADSVLLYGDLCRQQGGEE
jgi:hypothetical protein